ncbi:MAG TPA: lipase family protein [Methylomirabilota bacterium]|nr:lipase family protein [Methylomirabilota bacterium]
MPSRTRTILLGALLLAACTPKATDTAQPSSGAAVEPSAAPSASVAAGLPLAASTDAYYPTAEEVATAEPGQIIQSVEIRADQGTRAWFVVYGSTGLDGQPVAVSGMIVAPAQAPAEGGYPIVAWAHGTSGIADTCAPSIEGVNGLPPQIRGLVTKGYVVTATDYEGLGTDGIHPYIVGRSAGRSVLDSIRAATRLPQAHAGGQAVVIGLSQGGHAALWAAQLKPSYAPDLPLLGAFAASPPTDLVAFETWAFQQAAEGNIPAAYAPMLLFGVWNAIYDVPLGFLTDAGRSSALAGRAACGPSQLTTTPYRSDPAEIPEWRALLVGNSPGADVTDVPIRVVSPEDDESVGYDTQVSGVATMCAVGDTVELVSVGGGHEDSIVTPAAWAEAETWISDRFAGVAAVSTCSAS